MRPAWRRGCGGGRGGVSRGGYLRRRGVGGPWLEDPGGGGGAGTGGAPLGRAGGGAGVGELVRGRGGIAAGGGQEALRSNQA